MRLMAKIVVTPKSLENYGADLEAKAAEFSAILSSMDEIFASISSSWEGTDSDTFVTKGSAYINNLKAVQSALLEFGNLVKNCSVGYNNILAGFYSFLG